MTRQISTEASASPRHSPTSRALSTGTLALLCALTLSACSSLYFHDEEYEKQAKAAADLVKTIDAAPQIEAWGAKLDELQKQAEAQRADQILTERNFDVAVILDSPAGLARGGKDKIGLAHLTEKIKGRLKTLTGDDTIDDPAIFEEWTKIVRNGNPFDSFMRTLNHSRDDIEALRKQYRTATIDAEKERPLDCQSAKQPRADDPPADSPGGRALAALNLSCQGIVDDFEALPAALQAALAPVVAAYVTLSTEKIASLDDVACRAADTVSRNQRIAAVEALAQVVGGTPGFPADGGKASELKRLGSDMASILANRTIQLHCGALLKKQITNLGKKVEAPDTASANEALQKLLSQTQWLDSIAKSESFSGMADALDAIIKADLLRIVTTEDEQPAPGNPSCAKAAAADDATAKTDASTAATDKQKLDKCLVNASVTLVDRAVDAWRQIKDGTPKERLPSTLIAVNALNRQKSLIDADMAAQNARFAALTLALSSATNETMMLVEAGTALRAVSKTTPIDSSQSVLLIANKEAKDNAAYALAAYSTSVEKGHIPTAILTQRPVWIEHRRLLARDLVVARSSKSVIDQAMAVLNAYAAGGIKFEEVLRLLGNLGIIAAIAA